MSESFEVDREGANDWNKLKEQAAGSLSTSDYLPDIILEIEFHPGPNPISVCGSNDS